jgi:tryptophan-rich sensory protein
MSVTSAARNESGRRTLDLGALVLSIALVAVVAIVGGLSTETGPGSWYSTIDKPAWNPPGAVFGPVWTVLYIAMAIAAWLVWRERHRSDVRVPLGLYLAQLLANAAWTAIFFAAERPGWALVDIAILVALVVATIVAFRAVSHVAAWLLVPYLAWVCFATSITAAVVALN